MTTKTCCVNVGRIGVKVLLERKDRNDISIKALKRMYADTWEKIHDTFPSDLDTYDDEKRKIGDKKLTNCTNGILKLVRDYSPSNSSEEDEKWGTALKNIVYTFGTEVADFTDSNMRMLLINGFCEPTYEFINNAREFDAGIKINDILQALRNVWIMNCFQKLMNIKPEITPSILAYSLLYPYTDNYLDADTISLPRKNNLNERFERRLAGEQLDAANKHESKLYKLVSMIEKQYDRNAFPKVYQCLLAIQAAQCRSLTQQMGSTSEKSQGILDISMEKGGASVLADACLIRGSLSEGEAAFAFGFGILLQLVDDLQDAGTDRQRGQWTLFASDTSKAQSEADLNKLINFTGHMLKEVTCFKSKDSVETIELIRKGIMLLIFVDVACNEEMFSREYISALEKHSPCTFKSIKAASRKVQREYEKLRLKLAVMPVEASMAKAFASGKL